MFGGGKVPPEEYSRAFDNIVQDENDVVGLLAYALFKRAIREGAQQGQTSSGGTRNPSRTVVETYRAAAERTLEGVVQASLEANKPELQISAALDAIQSAKSDIREHVTKRTGFLPALITNIVAWAFTLLITVLILAALNRDPAQKIQERTQAIMPPTGAITEQKKGAAEATPAINSNAPQAIGSPSTP